MRRTAPRLAVIALLALVGCARNPPKPEPEPEPVDVAQQPPLPLPKPKIPPQRATAPAIPHTPSSPPAPRVLPGPDIVLVGLTQDEVRAILGEPTTHSGEGAGQSWTYRGKHCAVELTFFFDISRNNFYALDRRIEGVQGGENEAQICLKEIRDEQEQKL